MLNLSRVAVSPTLGSPYQIVRTTGHFDAGGWISDAPATLNAFGIVSAGTDRDLQQVPEGDRVTGSKFFVWIKPIYQTNESRSGISDVILFGGDQYRVKTVLVNGEAGYWKVHAVRMSGG